MKRNLQEGRRGARGTQIIYEGNGFAKVMKGGKLVERVQLEKGDNLLESLKALTEEVYEYGDLESQYEGRNFELIKEINEFLDKKKKVENERIKFDKSSKNLSTEEFNSKEEEVWNREFEVTEMENNLISKIKKFNNELSNLRRKSPEYKELYRRYLISTEL